MPIPPLPADFAQNRRDDGYDDFASLKASGRVRDMRGNIIGIDDPHTDFSARDRDKLFQAYVAWRMSHPSAEHESRWIAEHAARIIGKRTGKPMSPSRAARIVGQGCGEWAKDNAMWWRGVSL